AADALRGARRDLRARKRALTSAPPGCAARAPRKRQQADLAGLDLQREVFRVDAALGEAAGDEPQAGLRGAHEHVAELVPAVESPHRTDAPRDVLAEQFSNEMLLALAAGRE